MSDSVESVSSRQPRGKKVKRARKKKIKSVKEADDCLRSLKSSEFKWVKFKCLDSIPKADLKGKKVMVRVDLDVPLDYYSNIEDDIKIRAALPTIKYLMQHHARVILLSHLGCPGLTPKYSLKLVAPRLSELLEYDVKMATDCIGDEVDKLVTEIPEGGVLLLENVRLRREECRDKIEFGEKLASLADIFVHDAISGANRISPSTVWVCRFMKPKPAVAGFLMQKEIQYLVGALANPNRPVAAIVGGSSLSDKFRLIKSLLKKVDFLLLGGGIVFSFYKAMGYSVGSTLVEQSHLKMAEELMTKAKAKEKLIVLPSDVVIADRFGVNAERKVVPASEIPDRWMGLDIGPETMVSFGQKLETAKTIIWNGPVGVYEYPNFAAGTEAIAKKLAVLTEKGATTIVLGGDTVAAVKKVQLAGQITHISTGGIASVEILEGLMLRGPVTLTIMILLEALFVLMLLGYS